MKRYRLPERMRRIRDREAIEIERQARTLLTRLVSPAETLKATAALLSGRQRYAGAVGEHASLQDFEGILVMDALDEQLVRAVGRLLKRFIGSRKRGPGTKARTFVRSRLVPSPDELPEFPVGYSVVYALHRMLESFPTEECPEEIRSYEMERALIRELADVAERFMVSRDRPVKRHFSDVEREYSTVRRIRCGCGEAGFEIVTQSLEVEEGKTPCDRLELNCSVCGEKMNVTFDLPYFGDLATL